MITQTHRFELFPNRFSLLSKLLLSETSSYRISIRVEDRILFGRFRNPDFKLTIRQAPLCLFELAQGILHDLTVDSLLQGPLDCRFPYRHQLSVVVKCDSLLVEGLFGFVFLSIRLLFLVEDFRVISKDLLLIHKRLELSCSLLFVLFSLCNLFTRLYTDGLGRDDLLRLLGHNAA